MEKKNCLNCGCEFTSKQSRAKHCSVQCRVQYSVKLKKEGKSCPPEPKKYIPKSDVFDWREYNNEIIM